MYEKIIFFPVNEVIENAHLGVHFDYWFMGKTDKEMCDLIIQTTIYDHRENDLSKEVIYSSNFSDSSFLFEGVHYV